MTACWFRCRVAPNDRPDFVSVAAQLKNLDGIVVTILAIHDSAAERPDALIGRLNGLGKAPVRAGTDDPTGFDFIANATPAGMQDGDPLPVDVTRLAPSAYCGCVITKPEVSPFIAEARKRGCVTATGTDMYRQHQGIMVDFLLGTDAGR